MNAGFCGVHRLHPQVLEISHSQRKFCENAEKRIKATSESRGPAIACDSSSVFEVDEAVTLKVSPIISLPQHFIFFSRQSGSFAI